MAKQTFEPISWREFFDVRDDVHTNSGVSLHSHLSHSYKTFRIYRKGREGVLLLFLHGGGFSGLSWAHLTKLITEEINCQCIAIDIRGHGDTLCDDERDFSMETLSKYVLPPLNHFSSDLNDIIFSLFPAEAPQIILVGHSMGGAIAINLAKSHKIPSLSGLIVIDVVEGTAMEALKSMKGFLANRPKSFKSLSSAIEWRFVIIFRAVLRDFFHIWLSQRGEI
ncbi:Protein phosphatase methylesterase 1 [Cichlidogyrus casuarinus]|uniref:protein phosphatase methylesterase-1 n=1 Tax=Cichlidogyrus casuarinus TaxID=1844966 RepID=A0ABD2Q5S3_9PLAT